MNALSAEPPFTAAELEAARAFRRRAWPDAATRKRLNRSDYCPHQPMCPTVQVCVENIAWYLRHQRELIAEELAALEAAKGTA